MRIRLQVIFGLVAMALGSIAIAPASAALVVGAPGDTIEGGGNCFPFGCAEAWLPEYQQVYAAADFGGPGTFEIAGLEFYHTIAVGGALNFGTFTISLSTTSAAVNGLDTAILSNNVGADNTVVFNGTLPALSSNVLRFSLSSPFYYNSSMGNLLLDVFSADATNPDFSMLINARNGTAGGLFSRAMAGDNAAGTDGWGLVTGFTIRSVVPAPEPSTWALMLLGFAGLGCAGYRRAKSRAPHRQKGGRAPPPRSPVPHCNRVAHDHESGPLKLCGQTPN
jgi:PEP-CTERM motif